jgi:hypothetical protein
MKIEFEGFILRTYDKHVEMYKNSNKKRFIIIPTNFQFLYIIFSIKRINHQRLLKYFQCFNYTIITDTKSNYFFFDFQDYILNYTININKFESLYKYCQSLKINDKIFDKLRFKVNNEKYIKIVDLIGDKLFDQGFPAGNINFAIVSVYLNSPSEVNLEDN